MALVVLAFVGSLVCILTPNWFRVDFFIDGHGTYYGLVATKNEAISNWEPRDNIFEFKKNGKCKYKFSRKK